MTDIRKAAQAVIDEYSKHGLMMTGHDSGQVALAKLRQALAAPDPSVDVLIAEAVAKEREACAQIADGFYGHIRQYTTDVPDIGFAIRARGQK